MTMIIAMVMIMIMMMTAVMVMTMIMILILIMIMIRIIIIIITIIIIMAIIIIALPCGTYRRPSEPFSVCNSAKAFTWRLAYRRALAPIGARGLILFRINCLIPNRLSYPETLGVWMYGCMCA